MMSAKLATLGFLVIKIFRNKSYCIIISIHHVTNKTLSRYVKHRVCHKKAPPKVKNLYVSSFSQVIFSNFLVLLISIYLQFSYINKVS